MLVTKIIFKYCTGDMVSYPRPRNSEMQVATV